MNLKLASIALLLIAPLDFACASESVELTNCSASGAAISFKTLGTDGTVSNGSAVVPKTGEAVTFSVTGSADHSLTGATVRASSIIQGVTMPSYVDIKENDLSDFAQGDFSKKFSLTAKPAYPSLSFKAKISVFDANNSEVGCFTFPLSYKNT